MHASFKMCFVYDLSLNSLFLQDSISTPKVQEKLHENEARVKVLTEEWAGKWNEAAKILKVRI
jgi:kinesin family protein 16B